MIKTSKTRITDITPESIASELGISTEFLWWQARNTEKLYLPRRSKECNGKVREIDEPRVVERPFFKKLHKAIQGWRVFHVAAHGSIKKRSPKTSANEHCGEFCIITRDISKCFPSVTTNNLLKELLRIGFQKDSAVLLSKLLTVRGSIPQGASISSDAFNLFCIGIDRLIARKCREHNLVYTRYVDDCVISGKNKTAVEKVTQLLENEIQRVGLKVNRNKDNTAIAGMKPQLVHGYRVHRKSGIMISKEKSQDALDLIKEYMHQCRPLTPESIVNAAIIRQRLYGIMNYFYSAKFHIAKHIKRQIVTGDRLVLKQLKSFCLSSPNDKWWLIIKQKGKFIKNEPERLAKLWPNQESFKK
jgi:hypothetical protein